MALRLVSFNVNGIRAALKKNFLAWLKLDNAAILGLQEVKARWEQVETEFSDLTPKPAWNPAEKAGYSGVAAFFQQEPLNIEYGFGIPQFDSEGRIIILEYPQFFLYNIYFPNGQRDQERLDYKLDFYNAFLDHAQSRRETGKAIISCGDFNTAHQEIDLANPKANEMNSGFLPIERAWLDKFVAAGYSDTFRLFNQDGGQYSWWTYRLEARVRNIGWRIDYFFIDNEHRHWVKNAFILPEVQGSDHCPVGITIDPD